MSALPDQFPRSRSSPARPGGGSDGHRALSLPSPLLQVGTGLGLAGVFTGLILLVFDCAGFDAAMYFCPAVIGLGISGGVVSFLATRQSSDLPDPSVLAALFLAGLAILGGGMELAVWMQWPILFYQH